MNPTATENLVPITSVEDVKVGDRIRVNADAFRTDGGSFYHNNLTGTVETVYGQRQVRVSLDPDQTATGFAYYDFDKIMKVVADDTVPLNTVVTLDDGSTWDAEQVKALRDRVNSLSEQITLWMQRNTRANEALERFKTQVREVAERVKDEQNWCDEGFNSVMDELGLPRIEQDYDVEVRVPAYQYVTVTDTATNEDEARAKIENGDVDPWDNVNSYDWQYDDNRDVEIESVTVAS